MKLILLRVWIFGLAFGLGVSVSALRGLYKLYQRPQVTGSLFEPTPPPLQAPSLKIVGGLHACGLTNLHVYEVSDGSQITTDCEGFASSRAAERALQKRLNKAQVTERFPNLDGEGRLVGETLLVTTPTVLRLSRHGKSLCVTEAPSLKHLQVFEGRFSRTP